MDNIFQSKYWEEFKLKSGYRKSHRVDDILVLQKDLPLGRSMLYSPMVNQVQSEKLEVSSFIEEINRIAKESNSIFYRLELDVPSTIHALPSASGFKKSFEEMQPEHTWVLDITKDEETLLKEMSVRCRYNIKHASKQEVSVKSGIEQEKIDFFYNLYSTTGKRHGITYRAKTYFERLIEILGKDGYASIYTGEIENEAKAVPLTAGILIYSGEKAIYMFGASSNEMRQAKAPNLLVWKMIQDAKERGYKEFDFFGIAPTDDPKHPWAGITSFKKQFNGRQIDIAGSYDLVFRPTEYRIFKLAEKIRR